VRASDFARWAGPRAAHIQNVVTAVTMVTGGQDPSIPAAFEQRAAVTTAAGDVVTAVTETKPTFTSVIPMRPEARIPEESGADRCSNRGHRDDKAIEPEPTACREERAAIVEYGAGVPRAWAEGFARLDPVRPPADVPLRRWQQFIDDVGRFLDSGFAEKAATLGWGPFDIFGCDRDRPFARIDRQGLCWLIAGNRLVDLSEKTAIIQIWTGRRQTWRRKPSEPCRVLAWELADGEPGGKRV
jgi:hypothetical protein